MATATIRIKIGNRVRVLGIQCYGENEDQILDQIIDNGLIEERCMEWIYDEMELVNCKFDPPEPEPGEAEAEDEN